MEQDTLLKFENVSYTYEEEEENNRLAVRNISFEIKKGEFIVVLGHNGSGKSTIAKLSNSIYLPTSGRVLVDGMDTSVEENEIPCRKKIGVVFQNPDNQIVASIVEEDVAFGPENLNLPQKEIRARVDEALKAVGMYEYRLHETHRLSGGQKQRVAIAGIIAMRPAGIVLDEPTAMLDPKGRADILETVHTLNKELGMTVVLITHFMEEALHADRIFVINDAVVERTGTPDEIFSDAAFLETCGLELPDTAKLCLLLKKRGVSLPDRIFTPEALIEELVRQTERA
ncbi:MAG: energy-coupling factor transporter ATPase [Clostridia bacterium]|nr:energy-coupling factor transporter ATPase [Clostridia bacterium]